MKDAGMYYGVAQKAGVAINRNEKQYFWIEFLIKFVATEKEGEQAYEPVDNEFTRTVQWFLTPDARDNTKGKLQKIGFVGAMANDIPINQITGFEDGGTSLVCNHDEYNEKKREVWDVLMAIGSGSFEHKALSEEKLLDLNNWWSLSDQTKKPPTGAPQAPPAQSAKPEQSKPVGPGQNESTAGQPELPF